MLFRSAHTNLTGDYGTLQDERQPFRLPFYYPQPIYILTGRQYGGWQEQEIVQGQEGHQKANGSLREEGLVLHQGALHLRHPRVRKAFSPTTP